MRAPTTTSTARKATTPLSLSLLLCAVLACVLAASPSRGESGDDVGGGALEEGSTMRRFVFRLREGVDAEVFGKSHGLRLVGQVGSLRRYYEYEATEETAAGVVKRGSEWDSADPLEGSEWAEEQIPRVRAKRGIAEGERDEDTYTEPNDPLYGEQWHLGVIDAQGAWRQGVVGEGVRVTIVDDGLEYDHPDLKDNFCRECSHDFNGNKELPQPQAGDDHGTPAAGVAAARDNDVCGVGVAYRAQVGGIRLISATVTDAQEAAGLAYMHAKNDVYSCSWGPTDDGRRLEGPGPLAQEAMRGAVAEGRGGKGCVYIWAGGNGRKKGDNCNYDGYANSRYTITVAAVNSDGGQPYYSEDCAALMVSAPSGDSGKAGITTTAYRAGAGAACKHGFSGTSAAAPMAAGVAVLVLSANAGLTYRDVMHIFVRAASQNAPEDPSWGVNGAGLHHSHRFGFGTINASRAVELARGWAGVGAEAAWSTGTVVVRQAAGRGAAVHSAVVVPADLAVEWAEVAVVAAVKRRGDVAVTLQSPSGTVSRLAEAHGDTNANIDWTYTSCRHWGEHAVGTWTLNLINERSATDVTLVSWKLTLYGTKV